MSAILLGDLSQIALPRDLERLRREATAAASQGASLDALYAALAEEEPVALLEIAAGPKAIHGPLSVRATLPHLEVMERHMSPAGLYQSLCMVAEEATEDVIAAAAVRHPAAGWLIKLADRVEKIPGRTHLMETSEHPAFPSICWAHAQSGHIEALCATGPLGRAEPAAALLSVGQDQKAVEVAALVLEANPKAPVVAFFAAVRGPSVGTVLAELVPKIRSKEAAEKLVEDLVPFPEIRKNLKGTLPRLKE